MLYRGDISYLFSSVLFLELGILPFLIFFDHLRLFPPSDLSVGFPVQSGWARGLQPFADPSLLLPRLLLSRHHHLRPSLLHAVSASTLS